MRALYPTLNHFSLKGNLLCLFLTPYFHLESRLEYLCMIHKSKSSLFKLMLGVGAALQFILCVSFLRSPFKTTFFWLARGKLKIMLMTILRASWYVIGSMPLHFGLMIHSFAIYINNSCFLFVCSLFCFQSVFSVYVFVCLQSPQSCLLCSQVPSSFVHMS